MLFVKAGLEGRLLLLSFRSVNAPLESSTSPAGYPWTLMMAVRDLKTVICQYIAFFSQLCQGEPGPLFIANKSQFDVKER